MKDSLSPCQTTEMLLQLQKKLGVSSNQKIAEIMNCTPVAVCLWKKRGLKGVRLQLLKTKYPDLIFVQIMIIMIKKIIILLFQNIY